MKGRPRNVALDDVTARLIEALDAVFNSAEYQEFMQGRGFGTRWASGDDFAASMTQSDQSLGDTMRAVGLARAARAIFGVSWLARAVRGS